MRNLPWLYYPNGGVWLIYKTCPIVAIDWLGGRVSIRFFLKTSVRRGFECAVRS